MELLQAPTVERNPQRLANVGVARETNKLVGYLAATSRKRQSRLPSCIQSSSAAGKSSLMDAGRSFIHPKSKSATRDDRAKSVLHGRNESKNKILSISREDGKAVAQRQSYALKLLQAKDNVTCINAKIPAADEWKTQNTNVVRPPEESS